MLNFNVIARLLKSSGASGAVGQLARNPHESLDFCAPLDCPTRLIAPLVDVAAPRNAPPAPLTTLFSGASKSYTQQRLAGDCPTAPPAPLIFKGFGNIDYGTPADRLKTGQSALLDSPKIEDAVIPLSEMPPLLMDWFMSLVDGLATEPVALFDYCATFANGKTRSRLFVERIKPEDFKQAFAGYIEVVETRSPEPEPMTVAEVQELATLVWKQCEGMGRPREVAGEMFTALWLEGKRGLTGFRSAVEADRVLEAKRCQSDDDRIRCTSCANLADRCCLEARQLKATRDWQPDVTVLRRCERYQIGEPMC